MASVDTRSAREDDKPLTAGAKACVVCGSAGTLRCSGCRGPHYCTRRCQRRDWGRHQVECLVRGLPEKVDACERFALRALELGKFDQGIAMLRGMLDVVTDDDRRFAALNNLGLMLSKQGNDHEVVKAQEAKVEILKRGTNVPLRVRSLVDLSTAFSRVDRHDDAEETADEAFQEVGSDAALRALVRHRQGTVALGKGNAILAKQYLTEVISDPRLRETLPSNLRVSLAANLKKALQFVDIALDNGPEEDSDASPIADVFLDAECLYLARRDALAAADLFNDVLRRLDTVDHAPHLLTPTLSYLHNLYSLDLDDDVKARELRDRLSSSSSSNDDNNPLVGACCLCGGDLSSKESSSSSSSSSERHHRPFLTPCGHAFHFDCLLPTESCCPVCSQGGPTYEQRIKAFTATPFL